MTRRPPTGLLLLCLLAVAAALIGGGATMLAALDRAETQFDDVLDEKALSRALRIRRDLELAVDLGIPLAEIRGMWDYTSRIPENDPDIRFVAITDPDLVRLHYGGIGRERLDPLLEDPVLRAAAKATVQGEPDASDAAAIGGFSITTLPLLKDGDVLGFVHVAVQSKQLRERLYAQASGAIPLGLLALLLVVELVGFAYAAGYREPLGRLAALFEAAEQSDGTQFELSGRHAGGDLGVAMFRFNALMHRLGRRAGRFLAYADEVRRAVFEPTVAAQVAALAEQSELADGTEAGPRLIRRLDARPSDLRLPLVLGLAVAVAVPAWIGTLGEGTALVATLAAGLLGAAAGLLALPVGFSLIATLVLIGTALAAAGFGLLASWLPIAAAGGLLAGLAGRYARRHALRPKPLWLAARMATGMLLGLLAAGAGELLIDPWVAAALALAVGVGSMLLRPTVRHLAFARPQASGEPLGETV